MTDRHMQSPPPKTSSFLPDFCNIRIVFAVIIIAELLAFVLTLATPSVHGGDWGYLSLVSLYIQWIALISVAALCRVRSRLNTLSEKHVAIGAYLLLLAVTLILSEITYQISHNLIQGILLIRAGHWEFLGRNLAISAITSFLALRYFYLQHQLKLNIEAENQYRLQALQARIRPHFLFNSLNIIASLIRRQPERAEEAVEDLADIFRHTLDETAATTPFAAELETCKRYLHIEQLRLGDRLNLHWDIGDIPQDAALPSLTLQPLLENAIYHGISNLAEGGTIHCRGTRKGDMLYLQIRNPVAKNAPPPGRRMALDNIRQRLQANFEEQGRLKTTRQDSFFEVELRFPYQPAEAL